MDGPIRSLLQRRPLRNAVRRLVGLSPRYGSDPIETMAATDAMQGSDLDAMPTRRAARPVSQSRQFVGNTTAQTVSPSPEARAVRMQRDRDSDRRVQARRQEEGVAQTPVAPEPPATPADPAAPAVPQDPRLMQAKVYRDRANQTMQQIMDMESRLNPKDPSFVTQQTIAQARRLQAQRDEQTAVLLEGQVYAEQYNDRAAERAANLQRDLHLMQHPKEDLPTEANAFRQTVLQNGITSGAALATDGYFSALKMAVPSTDPQYQSRLQMNQLSAASVVLADRIANRRPLVSGDPTLAEMAAVIHRMYPKKPAERAAAVRSIVSNAQMQTRVSPEWAAKLAAALSREVEQQIQLQGK